MTRVLLTGAAGFIGSHVAEALVARGDEVFGVDSFDPFYSREIKERNLRALEGHARFRLIEGDVRTADLPIDPDTVVIHLAAKAGVRPSLEAPATYASVNVEGTARLLDLARRAGARRFVFGSSSSVYGDTSPAPYREDAPAVEAISPYGATKRAGELFCQMFSQIYRMRIASLRFFTVYGPRQRPDLAIHKFTRLIATGGGVPQFGDGSAERDYTYVDDVVAGVLRAGDWTAAAEPAHEVFNLGGGEPVRLDRLIAMLGERLGVVPRIEQHPPQVGDVRRTEADLAKATRVLGYRPATLIGAGLDRFVEWYRETYATQP
jgi:UDP-glucuronate 4-epimerase